PICSRRRRASSSLARNPRCAKLASAVESPRKRLRACPSNETLSARTCMFIYPRTDTTNRPESNAPHTSVQVFRIWARRLAERKIRRQRSGNGRLSNHLYWECRKQYGPRARKPAWHFWNSYLSKIEQVKDSQAC